MNPGSDSVTFIALGGSSRDSMGNRIVVETATVVHGCFFQPMRLEDKVSDTQYASSTHRCISPPVSAVLAINPEDRLTFGGVSYRVIGKKVFNSWSGRTDHVTVMCEEQNS